jgi:hypothetical protein
LKTTAKIKVSVSAARKIPGNVSNHKTRELHLSETGEQIPAPTKDRFYIPKREKNNPEI